MEGIKVTGRLKVEHIRDGKAIYSMERNNIVTTAGKNALAALLNTASAANSLVTHMAFGTSATSPAVGNTSLGTELSGGGYSRPTVTRSNPSGNMIQYVSTLTGLTNNPTVQEAGLVNSLTGGTLFAHQLTGAVNLATSADSLQVTWQVTFS